MERFETLPFKNDFMFSAVCHENPEIVRKMTEIIVGRKITKVHNIYQQDWGGIIVLNTTGIQTEDLPLNALLEYIHSGKKNEEELTEEIEEAADRIRYNKDWRERFMTIGEKIERESQKAAEEAKEQERFKAIVSAVQMLRELNYEEERIGHLVLKHFELSAEEYQRILEQISSSTCDGGRDS